MVKLEGQIWTPVEGKNDWERHPGERTVQWEAFVLYRDRGRGKRTHCYHKHIIPFIPGKGSRLDVWKRQWAWNERCDAYDSEQDRIAAVLDLENTKRSQELLFDAADKFMEVARQAAEGWRTTLEDWSLINSYTNTPEERLANPPPISPTQMGVLAETGQRIRNLAKYKPTSIVQVTDNRDLKKEAREIMESSATIPVVADLMSKLVDECGKLDVPNKITNPDVLDA